MTGRPAPFALMPGRSARRGAHKDMCPEGGSPMIAFDHVAVAVRRITDALDLFRDLLGGAPGEAGECRGFTFQQFTFPGGTGELFEPRGADSLPLSFLDRRGVCLHPSTFK